MYACLHTHSGYSLLDGLSKPTKIIERCVEVGIPAIALTDHGSLGGSVAFIKAKKQVIEKYQKDLSKTTNEALKDILGKHIDAAKKLKQILGCELYLSPQDSTIQNKENGKHSHLVVLAKNLTGWSSLVKLTNDSNQEHNFYRKPRLNLEKLTDYTKGNLIAFSGHMGSDLANCIFVDVKLAYSATSYDQAKSMVRTDWIKVLFDKIGQYQEIFGKENFFPEIQSIDNDNLPASIVVNQALRYASKKLNLEGVCTGDAHYPSRDDAKDQWILLCKNTTLNTVRRQIEQEDEVGLGGFFKSNSYHIPSPEEISAIHTESEIKTSLKIADMCESYDIMHTPSAPKFECPGGISSEEYFKKLCWEGFEQKIKGKVNNEQVYIDRINEELEVLTSAKILNDYFLIVHDYLNAARSRGEVAGPGRGSVSGCLSAFMMGITKVDSILYDLSFARFYNAGRNTPERVALPDIDSDFEPSKRENVINYIREKYGKEHVAQMGTFSRMMGRSALKNVLRVHEACSAEEMNRITEHIPDEAKIADELQLMREDGEDPSIVKWSLQNYPKELKEWCYLKEDGSLDGPMSKYFAQAMRLEGTIQGQSKHASGLIISDFNIYERIPMVRDKSSNELITGVSMDGVESLGGVKFDILGISLLSKLRGVSSLLANGTL